MLSIYSRSLGEQAVPRSDTRHPLYDQQHQSQEVYEDDKQRSVWHRKGMAGLLATAGPTLSYKYTVIGGMRLSNFGLTLGHSLRSRRRGRIVLLYSKD